MDVIAIAAAALGLAFAAGITYQQFREGRKQVNQHLTKAIALSIEARATHFAEHAAMGLYDGEGRMVPLDVVAREARTVC